MGQGSEQADVSTEAVGCRGCRGCRRTERVVENWVGCKEESEEMRV